MEIKKYRFVLLFVFFLALGIFFSALYMTINSKREIYENGLSSTGILFDVKSKYLKVRYKIRNETLTFGTNTPFQYLQNGEEYLIKYIADDPDYISVFYSVPIFSDQYKYDIIDCVSLSKRLSVLTFEYVVDEKRYVREILFEDGDSLDPNGYIIKYRSDNPKIGYLVKKI